MSDETHLDPLAAAGDPTTPAATLQKMALALFGQGSSLDLGLYHPKRRELLAALARNPASPIETLLALARRDASLWYFFPQNPGFELLLLTNPAILSSIPSKHLRRMVRAAETPAALLEHFAERIFASNRDPSEMRLITDHPRAPQSVLDRCFNSRDPALHPLAEGRASADLLALIERLGDPDAGRPPDPALAEADIERAVRLGGRAAALAAAHPSASPAQLTRLARSRDPLVRRFAARNPRTPASELVRLRSTQGERESLCLNPATPPEVVRQVVLDPDLHGPLARNPAARPEAIAGLLASLDAEARALAAAHPARPAGLLERLAAAGFAPDLSVAPEAPPAEPLLLELLPLGPWFHRLALGWMPLLPEAAQLALTRSSWVIFELTEAPGLSPAAIDRLRRHPDLHVRRALLRGPSASRELVDWVIDNEPHPRVLEAALDHPEAPADAVGRLISRVPTEYLLEKMATPPTHLLLEIVGRQADPGPVVAYLRKSATLEQRRLFSGHADWRLRRAITSNNEVEEELLDRLALDPEKSVREAVELARQQRERERARRKE